MRRNFEKSPSGLFIPEGATARGLFRVRVRDAKNRLVQAIESRNVLTQEFMDYLLNTGTGSAAQSSWYIAPFSGDVTPVETWTAATFNTNATELTTEYSESTRVAWTYAAAASQTKSNSASLARFTIASVTNIRGFSILSVSAKQATTGVCMCASRLDADLLSLQIGYKVDVQYDLGLANAA